VPNAGRADHTPFLDIEDELRPEYDLRGLLKDGVRGKYVGCRVGANPVLLDPDVAQAFPDQAAVNESLRLVIRLGETQPSHTWAVLHDGLQD
jgi:hypothetical protein